MAFFGVPLSGLIASQDQLSSVSNNLANLDTVGFKDQTASFSDLFAQSSLVNAANDPIETGLGVQASQTNSDFTDGGITSTGLASNMALSGNGFFVVQGTSGAPSYTRAGDFTVNASGFLTSASGEQVLGYGATNGVVSTSGTIQPLNVALGSVIPATATSSFQISGNLQASSAVGAAVSSTTQIFDSLGAPHTLTVSYTKTASNTWSYSVDVPTADTGAASSQVATGTLTFDSSGNLTAPAGNVPVSIPSFTDGAAAVNMSWSLRNANGAGTITQTDLGSSTSATQNGQGSGTLEGYSVQADGTIEGSYSNGQTNALGQVAIASFANTQGLLRTGNNDYQATPGSGSASIGTAETGGRGTITGGSVEASNVDVATEFSKLIVAQQAYSANAKTITTFQQVSEATIAMISA